MARRSTSYAKLRDAAFPIRVKVAVPPGGLGTELPRAHLWLAEELGRRRFAVTTAPAYVGDAAAFHFRSLKDARRFLAEFPEFRLADAAEQLTVPT